MKVWAETRGAARARATRALENIVQSMYVRCCVTEDSTIWLEQL